MLTQGRACIPLLDGLDEVADDRERQLVRAAVQRLRPTAAWATCWWRAVAPIERRSGAARRVSAAEVQPMILRR
ncbi:MAG: hypothetical protein R3A10_02770 [Caldilineaceae bacterium]